MKKKIGNTLLAAWFLLPVSACGQAATHTPSNQPEKNAKKIGGNCEICDAIYECPQPFSSLNETDTISCFNEPGPRLYISGIVYQPDGKTPATDVILYFYHTDQNGVYPTRGNEKGFARQNGYLRGWLKTNAKGEYNIYTLRPASYPNSRSPAHIHLVVKEKGFEAYWLDDFLFADDPYLSNEQQQRAPRGGSGVLKTEKKGDLMVAKRDIVLRKNVN